MLRISLKGMRARRLRTALTALAVLLGTTMIAGTYVFTDTIDAAFFSIFTDAAKGADAVVSGRTSNNADQFTVPPSVPESVVRTVSTLPGVRAVESQVSDIAAVVGRNGKVVKTGGAPTIALSYMRPPFQALEVTAGHPPRAPDDVAVDSETAKSQGFKLGQEVEIATQRPKRAFKLVGLVRFGGATLGGATFVVFDLHTAQQLFLKPNKVDFVSVAAQPGVSQEQLARTIAPVLPRDLQVKTASAQAQSNTDQISKQLGFLTTGLLAFGFISLFVGAFVIFNTFSITIAQRTREFALLRTLGATRRQVLGSVVFEALLVGLLASASGVGLGYLTAKGIGALFSAAGLKLPTTSPVMETRTVVVALIVGALTTLVASLGPALRATRVSPVAGLREGAVLPPGRFGRIAPFAGLALALIGAALVMSGLLGGAGLASTAGGAVGLVIGIALLSPRVVRPIATVAGWPLERFAHLVGRLARENAARNPARTAVTAAALMIGLALVLFVTIFAHGARVSIDRIIDHTFNGDLAVLNQDGGFTTIPSQTASAVAGVEGVRSVSVFKVADSRVAGAGHQFANGIDPATVADVYNFEWDDGSNAVLATLGSDGVLIERKVSKKLHAHVGDRVHVRTPSGGRESFVVRGIYHDPALLAGITLPLPSFERAFHQRRAISVLLRFDPGADRKRVERDVAAALRPFPEARARSQMQLKDERHKQINQILVLFYALLAMSVIVSLFGIVNTLTLSIYERTRELGLLRAVGMSRSQMRRLIRYESVITAAIGAVLGLALGVFFAAVVISSLSDEGIVFAVPWGQIAVLMVLALMLGVAAAAIPARRAAALDVLEAIAYE